MKRRWPRSWLLDGVKHHDDLRIAPPAAERLHVRIGVVLEPRLANRANAKAGALERRKMVVDRVGVERHIVLDARGRAEGAPPAVPRPRRMEVGVHEMPARAQRARHLARPRLEVL